MHPNQIVGYNIPPTFEIVLMSVQLTNFCFFGIYWLVNEYHASYYMSGVLVTMFLRQELALVHQSAIWGCIVQSHSVSGRAGI